MKERQYEKRAEWSVAKSAPPPPPPRLNFGCRIFSLWLQNFSFSKILSSFSGRTICFSELFQIFQNNRPKVAFLGTFWKICPKNCVLFGARKLVNTGAEGALRNSFCSVGQNWISQNCTKGDPWDRQGVGSLREGLRSATKTPLKMPLLNRVLIVFSES